MGLSQVYGFVTQTGGHVKLYSEPSDRHDGENLFSEGGAIAGRAVTQIDEPKIAAHIPRARKNETILVVEDDDDVRDYTVSSLRELGYLVFEAMDAACRA